MRNVGMVCLLLAGFSVGSFGAVDYDLLSLVPTGTAVISSIDVNQAKNSQFGQYLVSRINPQNSDFQQFVQQTGFNPMQDLQTVIFASPTGTANHNQKFLILARGNFNADRIKATVQSKGATVQTFQGVEILADSHNQQKTGIAFPDSGIAVMGDIASVEQAIANRANASSLAPAVQQLIAYVGPSNDAWFVSTTPSSFLGNHIPTGSNQPVPAQAVQSIVQASGGVQFGDTVRLSLNAVTRSAKDATSLIDVIRFGGSMIQMQRQKGAAGDALASAIDNMTLTSNGNTVQVSLSMPEKNLEQVANLGFGVSHMAKPTNR